MPSSFIIKWTFPCPVLNHFNCYLETSVQTMIVSISMQDMIVFLAYEVSQNKIFYWCARVRVFH